MADGRLVIDTILDTTGVSKGMHKLPGIVKVGVGAIAAGLGAAAVAGIKYNAQMEQYNASFETMLGSQEKAKKHMADLEKMAAETPFETSDLANASKMLLAFGVDVKDVKGSLQMLGDISQGNKEKFSALALVFGQVKSQGNLMGQDLLQMVNAGFHPLREISKKTGESMSSLKDKMSKGQISFEMVEDAMKSVTSEGGKFYGAMEKQSKTFEGRMSTLKDNVKKLLGGVMKPLTDLITNKLLPTAIKLVNSLDVKSILAGFSTLAKVLKVIAPTLLTIYATQKAIALINKGKAMYAGIETSVSVFKGANTALNIYGNSLKTSITATKLYGSSLTKVNGSLKLNQIIIGLLTKQMTFFQAKTLLAAKATALWNRALKFVAANKFVIIAAAIAIVVTGIVALYKNSEKVGKLFENVGTKVANFIKSIPKALAGIGSKTSSVFGKLVYTVSRVFVQIGKAVAEATPKIIAEIQRIFPLILDFLASKMPEMLETGSNLLISMIDGFTEMLPDLIQNGTDMMIMFIEGLAAALVVAIPIIASKIPTIMDSLVTAISTSLPKILNAALRIITVLANGLITAIPTLATTIPKIILAIVGFVTANLGKIIAVALKLVIALATGLIKAIPTLVKAVPKLIWAIIKAIGTLLVELVKAGGRIIASLLKGFAGGTGRFLSKVWSFAKSIPAKIKSGITGLAGIGANIVEGLWKGIGNKFDWIVGKIKGFTNGIKSKLKAFFHIKSPSRWARDIIGKNIVLGMAVGIDKTAKQAVASVRGLYDSVAEVDPARLPMPVIPFRRFGAAGVTGTAGDTNVNNTYNFYDKTKTPYETAKAIEKQNRHGLVGA